MSVRQILADDTGESIAGIKAQRDMLFRALQPFAEAWHRFPDLRERWKHIDNAEFKVAAQAVSRVRNDANGELDE